MAILSDQISSIGGAAAAKCRILPSEMGVPGIRIVGSQSGSGPVVQRSPEPVSPALEF